MTTKRATVSMVENHAGTFQAGLSYSATAEEIDDCQQDNRAQQ